MSVPDAWQQDPDSVAIWQRIQAMNRAWTVGDPAELAEYFHPDMVAITPVDRLRRLGRAACIEGWAGFRHMADIVRWQEQEPLVQRYGEAAVVSYYYQLDCRFGGGAISTLTGRDLFFLVRQQQRWWVVADQFSAFPGGA